MYYVCQIVQWTCTVCHAYRISDGEVTVELQELLHYGNLLLLDCHVKTSGTKLWIVHGQQSTSHVNVLPVWSMAKERTHNTLITMRSYSLAKMQVLLSNYIIYMHTQLPWPLHRHTKAPVEAVAAQLCQGTTAGHSCPPRCTYTGYIRVSLITAL